jgi:hypothetical protein
MTKRQFSINAQRVETTKRQWELGFDWSLGLENWQLSQTER